MRIVLFVLLMMSTVYANTTQNNTSGSNTSITGGYTTKTTYESGSSSSSTTTNNSTSNIRSAPPTAAAPNVTNTGSDVCLAGASEVFKLLELVYLEVNHLEIKNCERIKLSRELNTLGMKVARVAILCQDQRVFEAMEQVWNSMSF